MSQAQGTVEVRCDERGVAWLTLANAARLNAISLPMWQALAGALERFEHDAAVRVIVIAGQGPAAFCAGADVAQMDAARADPARSAEYDRLIGRTIERLQAFPKPTIAMIAGWCLGGGVTLALACDLRVAAEGSRFGVPAARLSVGYPYAGAKRLADLVGPSQAKRLLFTAERITVDQAIRIGLIDERVAPADLATRVAALAAGIASNAPLTLAAAKYAIETAYREPGERDLAGCEARVRTCIESEDHAEGRRAFLEKRPPVFRGR